MKTTLSIPCPWCMVSAGKPCVNDVGIPIESFHYYRILDALVEDMNTEENKLRFRYGQTDGNGVPSKQN